MAMKKKQPANNSADSCSSLYVFYLGFCSEDRSAYSLVWWILNTTCRDRAPFFNWSLLLHNYVFLSLNTSESEQKCVKIRPGCGKKRKIKLLGINRKITNITVTAIVVMVVVVTVSVIAKILMCWWWCCPM